MQEQFKRDRLEWEITIGLEDEVTDGVVAGVGDVNFDANLQRDTQTTVLFIYAEGNQLEGEVQKMVFRNLTLNK